MLQNKTKTQSGNVFIIILIAIFLFGALMFTFSRSGSQGVSSISKQEAKIAAQEILNYARLVEGAVDRIRRNGCSESEISFENSTIAGYTNPNSPADKSCHVFEDDGGKISFLNINEKKLDTSWSTETYYKEWLFTSVCAPTVPEAVMGDRCALSEIHDLVLLLPYLKKEVCEKIRGSSPPPWDEHKVGQRGRFIGSFGPEGSNQHNAISYNDDAMVGWKYGCFKSETFPPSYSFSDNKHPYIFFQVLHER